MQAVIRPKLTVDYWNLDSMVEWLAVQSIIDPERGLPRELRNPEMMIPL